MAIICPTAPPCKAPKTASEIDLAGYFAVGAKWARKYSRRLPGLTTP